MFDTLQTCKLVREGKEDIIFSSPCFNLFNIFSFAQGIAYYEKSLVKVYLRIGWQEFNYLCDVPYEDRDKKL